MGFTGGYITLFILAGVVMLMNCSDYREFPESEPMEYSEKRSVDQVVDALDDWLEKHMPEAAQSLNGPATEEQVRTLENVIGRSMPAAFRELYLRHNGQGDKEIALFPGGYEFLTLEEIEQDWKIMEQVRNDPGWPAIETEPKGLIRDSLWEPGWIPFARAISGDFLCIDLVPGPDGKKGQVFEFFHDDTYTRHRGYGMADFLGEFEQGLRSGKYIYYDEWSSFIQKSDLE